MAIRQNAIQMMAVSVLLLRSEMNSSSIFSLESPISTNVRVIATFSAMIIAKPFFTALSEGKNSGRVSQTNSNANSVHPAVWNR